MDPSRDTSGEAGMVRMNLIGDVMIGRSFNEFLDQNPDLDIWGNTRVVLQPDDINVINLETTITDAVVPWPGKPITYRLATRHADRLAEINPTFANIANNHILDYKDEGARSTMRILNSQGVAHVGVGEEYKDVIKPAVFQRAGRTYVFFAAADYPNYWDVTIARRPNEIGVWQFDIGTKGYRSVIQQVENARAKYGKEAIIVFSVHWGSNWVEDFNPGYMRRLFARDLIRAGVDIIHGTSSHHILPLEEMTVRVPGTNTSRTGIIFYGLGEFIDDYDVRDHYRSNIGLIGRIDIPPKGPPRLLDPIYIRISKLVNQKGHIQGMQVNTFSEKEDPSGDIGFFRPIVHRAFQPL